MNTYVQQCLEEGVRPYNRHNLHHTDHIQIYLNNASLTYSTILSLISFSLRSCSNFLLKKIGCEVMPILLLRLRNCLRTASVAIWSLKGRTILIVLPSSVFFLAGKHISHQWATRQAHRYTISLIKQLTIKLEKLIGGGNCKELSKFLFLKIKIKGLIKTGVGKGFVDQDVNSLN